MLEVRNHKLLAILAGTVLFFAIGCTPDPSSTSNTSNGSNPVVLNPSPDPGTGDPGDGPPVVNPGNNPGVGGPSASAPEPATGLLLLYAAGSAAVIRLRARKRA